jgi:diguanylate cyclase (GGDEF)-like protein
MIIPNTGSLRRIVLGSSIRGRVARTVMVVVIAPILLGASILSTTQRVELAAIAEGNLQNHATHQADAVSALLDRAHEAIAVLAENPVLHDPDSSTADLREQLLAYGLFDDLTLVDANGDAITSTTSGYTGRWDAKAAFRSALAGKEAMPAPLYDWSQGRPVVRFFAPVIDSNEVTAVIVGTMNMARVGQILDKTGIGETGFFLAVDRHGRVLVHPDEALMLEKLDIFESEDGTMTEGPTEYLSTDGAKFVGYAVRLDPSGWRIAAFQDERETYAVANSMFSRALLAGVLVPILATLAAIVLAGAISGPISRVAAAMGGVAEGRLDNRVASQGLEEIDALAASFNVMAEELDKRGRSLRAEMAERKRAEDRVRYQADHDALTGLPNRALLKDRLDVALADARRSGEPLAVVFLDLDHFKLVNDSVGHSAGDDLLQSVADRILATVREGDSLARVGGDEYVLLLPRIDGPEHALEVSGRIQASLRHPHVLLGKDFAITASIGIAMHPVDGPDAESLLRNADTAMYQVKAEGRAGTRLFSPDMDATVQERVSIESGLRTALELDQFVLHYQPQVSTDSGQIVGIEALLRWQDPKRGLVQPDRFIGVAEETGLIWDIGKWVIRTACEQLQAWRASGLIEGIPVAVNVSARQFHDVGIVDLVRDCLAASGLPSAQLELEITESTAMRDVEHTARTLALLKEMDVRVSIDDFGTGYSSLSYLKRFPVDAVKIDRSFVMDVNVNPDSAAIVGAIIGLAETMMMSTVAEGVETDEQLAYLRERGCDSFQGFLYSRALPAAELTELLAREASRESAKSKPRKAAQVPAGPAIVANR